MPSFLPLFVAAHSILLYAPPAAPAGTPLHVRLTSAVGTFASRSHSPVGAVLIAPVKAEGETILPAGSVLAGEVKAVRRVGLGVVHESASMQLDFSSVTLPNGDAFPLATKMAAVDNAREVVTPHGSIQKGRSTASLGNRVALYIRKLALLDVHAALIVWAVRATIVQVPEPEIYFPTGTELTLTLTSPVRTLAQEAGLGEPRGLTDEERERLAPVVDALPVRTSAEFNERPSDPVNVVFIGSRQQVSAAFTAAGWFEALPRTTHNDLASVWAIVRNTPSPRAPLSPMLLNDAPADVAWQKGFNDFAKRHHVRLWEQSETFDGQQVWAAAATRDVDYAYFRKGKPMTHQVARLVDNERDKIAADLAFTSCADAVDWVDRPGFPHVMKGATGDMMETDGRVLVVRLNDCDSPNKVGNALEADTLPEHGGPFQRVMRRQIMCFRSDLLRTNVYWRSYEGARMLVSAFHHRQVVDPDAAPQQTFASRWFPDDLNSIISYH
jgi:hypothetical protein